MQIGLKISEVAHDIQAQVSKYVSEKLGLVNSYDTWHGMFLLRPSPRLTTIADDPHRNKECGQDDEDH